MDKKQFFAVISEVYKYLSPSKVSVFIKNDDTTIVRIVSESFKDMTFSARNRLLNNELQVKQPLIFESGIFIFEAFTSSEVEALPISDKNVENEAIDGKCSESAKDLV